MKTIDDYLDKLGPALVEHARKAHPPLHSLADSVLPGLDLLGRKLLPRQAHAVTAAVKAFRSGVNRIELIGECGTGKTCMAASIVAMHGGKGYRALVTCPAHLTEKWPTEIKTSIPHAKIHVIEHWRDVLKIPRKKSTRPEWIIIGKDKAKLDPYWEAAAMHRRSDPEIICDRCGEQPRTAKGVPIGMESLGKSKSLCRFCGNPLWTFTSEIRRWSPARTIRKRLSGFIDYYICDEGHQCKGEDTEIAKAFHRLLLASRYFMLLTGTMSGGKAEDLLPLLHRIHPDRMREEGWEWDNPKPFLERYGRLETTIRTKGDSTKKSVRCVPGIMPDLFGRLLIDSAIFVSLEDVAEGLPEYEEVLVPVDMEPELRNEYTRIEGDLRSTLQLMLKKNDKRLLGAMLTTLLAYPDYPFDWKPVGYREREITLAGMTERFVQVTHPTSLTRKAVYNKERELVRICREAKASGCQAWVYVQYVNEHDMPARLKSVLEDHGFSVSVLRQKVEAGKREAWIRENGPKFDVIISHPGLVETGVDLFDKGGAHNFNWIIFYQCGYSLYTLRQASRRAMRLSQVKACRTFFLFHRDSMSERAISLMGSKLLFAEGLEGRYSTEGLVSMGADDSIIIALAKSLCERINSPAEWRGASMRHSVHSRPMKQKVFEVVK